MAILLTATSFVAYQAAPSSAALVSQFQAQSPVSFYIPANQPVPAQGSTVTFSWDRQDFTGPNADSEYQDALGTGPTATVTYVVADLGYVTYPDVNTIASNGDLGYLVLLDFGGLPDFDYAFVGYVTFSSAATSADAVGVSGIFQFSDGGTDYLWAPSSIDTSAVTGVVDAWSFQTLTGITATASHVLDCNTVVSGSSDCAALANKAGTRLTLANQPSGSPVDPEDFIGLAGLTSTIVGGLVQNSTVTLPGQTTPSGPSEENDPVKYSGPELSPISGYEVFAGASAELQGKRLNEISSIEIGGKAATFTATSATELSLAVPADLAPGLYDLVINSSAGKLTHINAIQVREPRKSFSITTRSTGKISESQYQEHALISAMQIPELNKARCIVNASSIAMAKAMANRLCALVKAANPYIQTTVVVPRSTVMNDTVYARVIYGWN